MDRRTCLALLLAGCAPAAASPAPAKVRLGVLQLGTVQWVADVMARHHLDRAHGFALHTAPLANTGAGRVMLMSGAADIVVSDWLFAAARRTAGMPLSFAPFTSATGGIMVVASAPIRAVPDLSGRSLGVAGGPTDKSWLIVQAAAREAHALDLATAARVVYGAPPLLEAKLKQGELDAVLTFWNYAARLEAAGCREMVSVAECARSLGLPGRLNLVGFVFREDWAEAHRRAIDGFLAAAAGAERKLANSQAEWTRIRPLMNAPDDALFNSLRRRFVEGIGQPSVAQQQQSATRVLEVLLRTGGRHATDGLRKLPDGLFWRRADAV